MKRPTLFLICAAILLVTLSVWATGLRANVRSQAGSVLPGPRSDEYPINRTCVVTVDPLTLSKPVVAGKENIVTGFRAPDTVEGVLTRMDSNWLVLIEDDNENWIPTAKVIMIHVRK